MIHLLAAEAVAQAAVPAGSAWIQLGVDTLVAAAHMAVVVATAQAMALLEVLVARSVLSGVLVAHFRQLTQGIYNDHSRQPKIQARHQTGRHALRGRLLR
jgi:hypothetical protein